MRLRIELLFSEVYFRSPEWADLEMGMDLDRHDTWLRRLDLEVHRQGTDSGKYEMRLAQLRAVYESNAEVPVFHTTQDLLTTRLMIKQLCRWLGSHVRAEGKPGPDECRTLYPLAEIDRFVSSAVDRYKEHRATMRS